VLVRGDMDIAATCTVTYIDPQRLLACGHPLMQFGQVDLPMTKATVVATLASPLNAFQDRQYHRDNRLILCRIATTAILGEMGKEPKMIPVTVTVRGGPATKEFHYEILNNARLSSPRVGDDGDRLQTPMHGHQRLRR